MPDAIEIIRSRRSVRSFQDIPVQEDQIGKIIECACFAPSGLNPQPWRFIVLTNPDIRDDIAERTLNHAWQALEKIKVHLPERYRSIKERFNDLQDPVFFKAPVVIFIVGTGMWAEVPCVLAAGNLMLAAVSVGLGACFADFGALSFKDPECRRILGIKKGEKINAVVIAGYETDQKTPASPRKKTNVSWI